MVRRLGVIGNRHEAVRARLVGNIARTLCHCGVGGLITGDRSAQAVQKDEQEDSAREHVGLEEGERALGKVVKEAEVVAYEHVGNGQEQQGAAASRSRGGKSVRGRAMAKMGSATP